MTDKPTKLNTTPTGEKHKVVAINAKMEQEHANKWRLHVAEELLAEFKADTGHDATSIEELEAWYGKRRPTV